MQTSPLRTHHTELGARPAPPGLPIAALTHGDPPAEHLAALEGAALFDTSERGLVRVSGGDAESFLHRIVANTIKGLEPGDGNRNLLLTGKGKVVQDFDLARLADDVYELSTPPGEAPRLVEGLDLYLFGEDVALEDRSDSHAPLELVGPSAAAILEAVLLAAPPTTDRAHVELAFGDGTARVTHLVVAGVPGWRVDVGPDHVVELWRALTAAGATPAGLVAWDALRAENVFAAWGLDITQDVYPQEARLEPAFSLDKGCYIGQEVVAKIDTYGGLNKRLMLLRASNDDPVPPGTRLVRVDGDEARDLGVATTWAYSFELDGGVVLGYVKRKHQDEGTTFHLVPPGADPAPDHPTATVVR